jgi:hypothetical protein
MQGRSSNSNIRCFRCGEPSHLLTDCQKLASITSKYLLFEDETVEDQVDIRDPVFYEGDDKEIMH